MTDFLTGVPNPHEPDSVEWWRQRMLARLLQRNAESLGWWAYYYTDYPPPDVEAKYSDAYRLLLMESRHAWAKLITSAINERISLESFIVGDEDTSLAVWRDFVRNHMNADQRSVHLDALITGYGYVSVWPVDGTSKVRAESAVQAIHEPDPEDNRITRTGFKLFFDEVFGTWHSTLWFPGEVWEWQLPVARASNGTWQANLDWTNVNQDWQLTAAYDNPLAKVPLVPFINEPDMLRTGHSEVEPVESTLRRIDRLSLDLLLAAETAAFRQKWATGLKIPKDPESGKPVQPFNVALDKLWATANENAKFGSFEATQLEGYIRALGEAVAQLAAISRVPAHYLLSDSLANPPSAETVEASEAGLLAKVIDRQNWWGESWEQVVRLMMLADDAFGADQELLSDVSVIWQEPARKNESALADAAVKWQAVGVPREVIWSRLGASPAEIVVWRNMKLMQAMEAQLLGVPAATDEVPNEDESGVQVPVANQLPRGE